MSKRRAARGIARDFDQTSTARQPSVSGAITWPSAEISIDSSLVQVCAPSRDRVCLRTKPAGDFPVTISRSAGLLAIDASTNCRSPPQRAQRPCRATVRARPRHGSADQRGAEIEKGPLSDSRERVARRVTRRCRQVGGWVAGMDRAQPGTAAFAAWPVRVLLHMRGRSPWRSVGHTYGHTADT
jgi:hypothetical protein